MVGCGSDEFVAAFLAKNGADAFTKAGFPSGEGSLKLNHIYMELFRRRNRIMHWGQVDYRETDSRAALKAGRIAFAILKLMDKERYEAMEKAWRASLQ